MLGAKKTLLLRTFIQLTTFANYVVVCKVIVSNFVNHEVLLVYNLDVYVLLRNYTVVYEWNNTGEPFSQQWDTKQGK